MLVGVQLRGSVLLSALRPFSGQIIGRSHWVNSILGLVNARRHSVRINRISNRYRLWKRLVNSLRDPNTMHEDRQLSRDRSNRTFACILPAPFGKS